MSCRDTKHPSAEKDWSKDWSTWLDGDVIQTSAWAVSGPDASLVITNDTNSTTLATVWLDGGTEGMTYRVENTIVTQAGRTEVEVLWMEITK